MNKKVKKTKHTAEQQRPNLPNKGKRKRARSRNANADAGAGYDGGPLSKDDY